MREQMSVGYARRVSGEQHADLDAQVATLDRAWAEKVYRVPAGADDAARRRQFAAMLVALQPGDMLLVTGLANLAPTPTELVSIVEKLAEMGIGLRVLDIGLDTNAATAAERQHRQGVGGGQVHGAGTNRAGEVNRGAEAGHPRLGRDGDRCEAGHRRASDTLPRHHFGLLPPPACLPGPCLANSP
jgi:hypothetical protein